MSGVGGVSNLVFYAQLTIVVISGRRWMRQRIQMTRPRCKKIQSPWSFPRDEIELISQMWAVHSHFTGKGQY